MTNLTFIDKVSLSLSVLLLVSIILYLIIQKLLSSVSGAGGTRASGRAVLSPTPVHSPSETLRKHNVPEPHFEPYCESHKYAILDDVFGEDDYNHSSDFQEGFGLSDIGDFFNKIGDFFNKIGRFFRALEQLGPRFTRFGQFFPDFGTGIKMEFDNLGAALKLGFEDIFDVIRKSFSWFESLMNTSVGCFKKYMDNFRFCSIFYFLDIVYWIIYALCYKAPLYILQCVTGFDLGELLHDLWDQIVVPMDDLFHDITADPDTGEGLHLIHWPDYVQETCYSCDVIKIIESRSEITDAAAKVDDDWKHTIPALLSEPQDQFKQAWGDVTQLFQPLDF